jgi:periplasmic divalent cation tolerance protein
MLKSDDWVIYGGERMGEYIQVTTTVEKKEDAEVIAAALLEKKLAACVQILGPMVSYFRWREKIDHAEEYLCLIKSRMDLFLQLEEAIKARHPYEVPEIIAQPIVAGGKEYLQWMEGELLPGA